MILVERFIKQKPIKSFDPKAFNTKLLKVAHSLLPSQQKLKLRLHNYRHLC